MSSLWDSLLTEHKHLEETHRAIVQKLQKRSNCPYCKQDPFRADTELVTHCEMEYGSRLGMYDIYMNKNVKQVNRSCTVSPWRHFTARKRVKRRIHIQCTEGMCNASQLLYIRHTQCMYIHMYIHMHKHWSRSYQQSLLYVLYRKPRVTKAKRPNQRLSRKLNDTCSYLPHLCQWVLWWSCWSYIHSL